MNGFLHTGATFTADLNLVIQIGMGAALLFGARLARQRRFRAHGACQTAVMVLNLVMIAVIMVPSFDRQVAPNLRSAFADRYYALPLVHAGLGTLAELLGLYVVLVARGVQFVPATLRFHNYRAWMRTTLVLWWMVLGLGVATYVVWYAGRDTAASATLAPMPVSPTPAPAAAASPSTAAITVQNFAFEPKEITVPAGTTITWTDAGGRHTIESADGFLKSETLVAGQTYQKQFDRPGVYDYYCGFHGDKDGSGMTGRITVVAK